MQIRLAVTMQSSFVKFTGHFRAGNGDQVRKVLSL